jgi:hypothetical protein
MHPNAMAERRENGTRALIALELHYANGSPVENLTDLLCDLMHAGVLPSRVLEAARLACDHYAAECAEPDTSGDDAADAADARAEGMIP